MIAMRRVLLFLPFCLWSLLIVIAADGALPGCCIDTPAPEIPQLSGMLTKRSIEVGGLTRTYATCEPRGLPQGAIQQAESR